MAKKVKKTVILRGHHLNMLRYLYRSGFEAEKDIRNRMGGNGYEGQFIDFIILFLKMIINDSENILLKLIDDYDDICDKCNKRINKKCPTNHFAVYNDRDITKWLCLEIGRTYEAKEILKILKKEEQ